MKAPTPTAPPITGISWRAASTHLPYAQPKFGTLCAANAPELYGERFDDNRVKSMMGDSSGFMVLVPHEDVEHDH